MTRPVLVLVLVAVLVPACPRNKVLPRPDGAAVVVTPPPFAEGDVTFVSETEPNDTLAVAQKLDFAGGATARGISATLHEPQGKTRDVDLYRVDIPQPDGGQPPAPAADGAPPVVLRRLLRIDARPEPALAVALEALDDRGQPLVAAGSGQAGEALAVPNLAVTPGTYFVRVKPGGDAASPAAGAYRLVVRLAPLDAGAEVEPNGKGAFATELSPSGEAVGYIGWRRDQDWYRVPLAGLDEGSVLSADLEAVPGVVASLAVHDSVEQKLTEARGRKEQRVALRNVRLPLGEPHVFVVVRADSGWNGEVRYNLRLRTEVPKGGGEAEPNDDIQHAQPIADGLTLGYLGRGDTDVFRYVAAAPAELDVEVTPPERVDLRLEALREGAVVLARTDSGRRREPERLPNLYAPGGPIFLRLSAKGDGNPDEPYRLQVSSRPPEPGGEREPNDLIAKATPLAVGATGTGLLAPRGDIDFWQATATPDADGNVTITVGGVAAVTLDVAVSSPGGRQLARFKVPAGQPPAPHPIKAGVDGCCIVEVRDASGKAANPRDRYTVTVGK